MQGFNKYYPPDYDGEKHKSLNSYRGKHALGDRARKIDQGILITRFELPFNIWCGGCDAHIGMGVRYNAEKRKIGNYYSTPIYAFRCKCHLCSHWFEIRTDPQNTRYVVESGARQKAEDWNPEENGGYAVHENDPSKKEPLDPLQSLEKSTTQEENYQKHARPHLEQLQDLSAARSADPYSLSVKLRKGFRQGKHAALKIKAEDDTIKDKYGLDAGIKLVDKNDPSLVLEAKAEWEEGQKRREEEEAKRKLYDAQSGPVEFQTRVGSSSTAGFSSAAASSSRVSIQSPPRKGHSVSRPMHKVHAQPHTSKPILKKDQIAKAAKAKAMSTLASTLISNSARKIDPFARDGVGGMSRGSTGLPRLSRKL
ncbi:Coiled-coil domain-containing protein 130 OS=Bos taurus GN=CCDC130 PE=2 SV=1 [Rhizoctonia solani AG-1 IB]|uniref:Coiled-coil domain-containing protein 130 n=1 Tax=Thanatephorus cucumeris (strain AG1-IB / isolate 7/3/14) TaxID=1108050 RepID=M5BST2_THACB|nr:Coiled-coil domain-containing protein 130 [Rhizoctonia solani AG-1 IB]CEL55250.1 Coiled-coil domain-containing protein 130 OS=Bos taurus GN=CCDC130 PE=2 SV=1 [Rhizoctonia solani AG-1 IB]